MKTDPAPQNLPVPRDFDLTVGEVFLVHRNCFAPGFRFSDYRGGRPGDGIVFAVAGGGEYLFPEGRFTLRPGEAMFLPAGSRYTLTAIGQESFIHYTANFRLEDFSPREDGFLSGVFAGGSRISSPAAGADRLTRLWERLLAVWDAKGAGYRPLARATVTELLCAYLSLCRPTEECEADARLAPARALLDTSFTEPLSLARLSALCGLSETHFRRLFSRTYGMSPAAYRTNRRLLRAQDMLTTRLYPVSEVAAACGFPDVNYFCRVFKKTVGISPGAFRRGS